MINKVVINHFKKFDQLEFKLPSHLVHLVIVGPNNSGKTTLLQAIGAWSEIASQWLEKNPGLARKEDNNYLSTHLNLLRFYSVPLKDFDHLWKNKDIQKPASVWLHTDQWKIGFEVIYEQAELVSIRPVKEVKENDLEKYIEKPLIPVYIPTASGLDSEEDHFNNQDLIKQHLAKAQAGKILRNLILSVSKNRTKWEELQRIIKTFFGYELTHPSAGAQIYIRYRHSSQGQLYELSSASSGFLQVLLIYARVLASKGKSVLLIDEPDAHLHILLQDKMYQELQKLSQENQSQLIISTHSRELINATKGKGLYVFAGDTLSGISDTKKVISTLNLETTDIVLAKIKPYILYVEGDTDINILREWARVLGHCLLSFLEPSPFYKKIKSSKFHEGIQSRWTAVKHFSALRAMVPHLHGVELYDSDEKVHSDSKDRPKGMISPLYWRRREIENYLLHPKSIIRFVKSKMPENVERVEKWMKKQLPLAWHENPLENSDFMQGLQGKDFLSKFFQEARLDVEKKDFYQIAAQMKKDEIYPEVIEKLDSIAKHFNLEEKEQKTKDC